MFDVAAQRAQDPEAPWVETDQLSAHLDAIDADEETRRFAFQLAEDGLAIIDFDAADVQGLVDKAVAETDPYFVDGITRVQDAWREKQAVKALAVHPKIIRLLKAAYGREPFAFQTLNFQKGSQQSLHADAFHFHSEPPRFMCGVWFALEDIRVEAGPLTFRKGSHRLPIMTLQEAGVKPQRSGSTAYAETYVPALTKRVDEAEAPSEVALLKKGQALVWAANLAHGGGPITDPEATRKSLVTHFFFENCLYHTPMSGSEDGSKLRLRLPSNVATGGWVWPRRRGRRVAIRPNLLAITVLRRLLNRPLKF